MYVCVCMCMYVCMYVYSRYYIRMYVVGRGCVMKTSPLRSTTFICEENKMAAVDKSTTIKNVTSKLSSLQLDGVSTQLDHIVKVFFDTYLQLRQLRKSLDQHMDDVCVCLCACVCVCMYVCMLCRVILI